MKTLLQSLNDVAGQYISMPLQRFFIYVTIVLWVTLILIALFAPLSLPKFMALIGLYSTSIITALLSYANSMIREDSDELETVCETPVLEDEESNELPNTNSAFVA